MKYRKEWLKLGIHGDKNNGMGERIKKISNFGIIFLLHKRSISDMKIKMMVHFLCFGKISFKFFK